MSKKNFRLFGFINPADIVIAAAIIGFTLWAALDFSAPRETKARAEDVLIRYVVELKEKPEGFFQKIEPNATLYDTEKGYAIGTIVDSYALPYLEDVPDEQNGIIRRTEVAGLEFTYVVVEAYAAVSDSSTSVGQYSVAVNKEVFVKSKTFAGQGYICLIERRDSRI